MPRHKIDEPDPDDAFHVFALELDEGVAKSTAKGNRWKSALHPFGKELE